MSTSASNGCWYPHSIQSLNSPSLWRVPPSEANLFAYKPPLQGWHEHWTNIHRIWYLVEKHPQIETVRQHKKTKALDPKRFDSYGRAAKFHQAPFDLAIGLAASGASASRRIMSIKKTLRNIGVG